MEFTLNTKDRRALYLAASDGGGMYPGVQADVISGKVYRKLMLAGLIQDYCPHNPVHKVRIVATNKGRQVLEDSPK